MRADPADMRHHTAAAACQAKTKAGTLCPVRTHYRCRRCQLELCGNHSTAHWCEPAQVAS